MMQAPRSLFFRMNNFLWPKEDIADFYFFNFVAYDPYLSDAKTGLNEIL